jgi:hypothetical protein
MKPDKITLILPVLLITVGSGWLLSTAGVMPGVDWIWTLGLAVVGMLTFVVGRFDKVTAVVGPFLIIASCLSVLRQTGRLHVDLEVPILVITAGVLTLVARAPMIPAPRWFIADPNAPTMRGRDE